MKFFTKERDWFTPYNKTTDLLVDLSFIVRDPLQALGEFLPNFMKFLLWSFPLAIALLALNTPILILLSLPIAVSLLTLNTQMMVAMALLSAPAIYYLGLSVYRAVDLVLSPIIDCLRILSNLGATLVGSGDMSMARSH